MLSSAVGIYAARVISAKSIRENKKEVKVVGPHAIAFDKASKLYQIVIDGPLEDAFYNEEDVRMLEIYVREKQIDKIVYQGEAERVDVKHLKCVYRMPLEYFPDPRVLIEDGIDAEHRENMMRQKEADEAHRREI